VGISHAPTVTFCRQSHKMRNTVVSPT
jgi:hypothetical protein